ncbi:MAG TPA: hypothetical protein VJH92_05560 [Candidatus Nanoarchaeia archaeon]|nr:hypothetical protein [Candidatus Nanoarchaeia archaeon]
MKINNREKSQRFFCPSFFPKTRKAQLFTVLAILLLFLMFFSFEIFSMIRERQAITTRVATMDSFLKSIEDNLERQMYIAGFRIIFLAESHITSTGSYINVNDFFNEAFFNGTVYGQPNQSILQGATYSDFISSINNKANRISVNVTLYNSTITISQDDPWNVKFTLTSNLTMEDNRQLARWQKQQIITAYIPVQGFVDPLFTVESHAIISRKINKTIYEGQYVSPSDELTNFTDHVTKGLYAENSDAPSFLMKLEGNLSGDVNGIESIVYIPDFTTNVPGFVKEDKSVVDHIYFSEAWPIPQQIDGMPTSWFWIDEDHRIRYGLPKKK